MTEIHGDPWVNQVKINLVTRSEWGALPPKKELDPLPLPVRYIVYSCNTEVKDVCTTKEDCIKVVQEIQKKHMEEKGLDDIAYNFLIGDDNNVYEGRGFDDIPAIFYEDQNKYYKSIDVAYIGIHEAKYLHWSMHESAEWLKDYGIKNGWVEERYKEIDLCDKEDYFEGFAELAEEENKQLENTAEPSAT